GGHRIVTAIGNSSIAVARQAAKRWGYLNSHFLRWAEEGLTYSLQEGTWSKGFGMLHSVRNHPAYHLNMMRVVAEGVGYLGLLAGSFWGGAQLSSRKDD
ncbi:MAG: hypothetical protein ABJA76_16955, partial [Mucilaginibacter sp.]